MLTITKFLGTLILLISIAGCGKTLSKAEIDKRAEELVAERQHKEELAAQEAVKIAEERERLTALQQEQREKVAADLSSRGEQKQAERAANMERAAAEQARRDAIAAEVKGFVDSLYITLTQLNEIVILRMNGQAVKEGSVLVSPAGCSVTYLKQDGDYFQFTYEEDAFKVTLKKTSGGLASTQVQNKQPLASGFEIGQPVAASLPTDGTSIPAFPSSTGLMVLKATFGAGKVQRDVKDLVKAKLQNGRLNFGAGSGELGGDPASGQVKTFYIKYLYQGRLLEKSFRENERVSLP